MESTSISELLQLFDKSYKCFEMFNDIIRLTTISRILMNIYENKTSRTTEIYIDRFQSYSDSMIVTIAQLKELVDIYGNMGKFSDSFQSKYGYVMLSELMIDEDYESLTSKYEDVNCTYEVALNKYLNKAIQLSSYVSKLSMENSLSNVEKGEFQRIFYFLVTNGKNIMRESSEVLADTLYYYMKSSLTSKENVCF